MSKLELTPLNTATFCGSFALLLSLWIGTAPVQAQSDNGWNPSEIKGPCTFVMPSWDDFPNKIPPLYTNVDTSWSDQLRAATLAKANREKRKLNAGDLIDIRDLTTDKGQRFINRCDGDGDDGEDTSSPEAQGDRSTTPREDPPPQGEDILLEKFLEHLQPTTDRLFRAQDEQTTLLLIGVALLAAQPLLLGLLFRWLLKKKGDRGPVLAANQSLDRSSGNRLENLLRDLAIYLKRLEEAIEKLAENRPKDQQRSPAFPTAPSQPPPRAEPLPTEPARSAFQQAIPGTGIVSRLQESYGGQLQSCHFEGTTQRFCRGQNGDYYLVEAEQLILPRVSRIRRAADWYAIGSGFHFDNRSRGTLFIDEQPSISRQSDGSYLLESKGRLRAVQDE